MSKDLNTIIRRPIITERASELQESGKYIFEVRGDANKIEIRKAVESIWKVEVKDVRTANFRGKVKRMGRFAGRRPDWKKAYVTLAEGQTIPEMG